MAKEVDIEKYTKHETYKNLVAIEQHVAHFFDDKMFCIECLKKHFSYLEMLAEECSPAQCKLNSVYKDLKKWAAEIIENLGNLDESQVKEIAIQSRNFRKRLDLEETTGRHLK